jgi:15-cis-phytoene synthase
LTIVEAYAVCREIAQREAKNFYYAFRVLPEPKRNAMCAVYAFMRRADDITDDETMPVEPRRGVMKQWVECWRTARATGVSEDPVFVALNDTQKRFGIPDALLEELVQGTAMDLEPRETREGELQTFATFEELYRYCYLVASVVGLVCIRIFGYTDARAEKLAEETGVAFQLTNILRDVREDAERGRIYVPMDMLGRFGVTPDELIRTTGGAQVSAPVRKMLGELSQMAWRYYGASRELIPLIDADSRAALWVLVKIYSGLLTRIDARNGDVFSERVRVSTPAKLVILAEGAAMALRNRVAS